jgi:hypothetical protein
LGFIDLPQGFRNNDNVKDAADALIEALGIYWRSVNNTGEIGGSQSRKSKASNVCVQRKKLAKELIAAMANAEYLGTDPSLCTYVNAGTNTTFPSDLISQAITVAAGVDVGAMTSMTALLRAFNNDGQINDFPTGIVDCTPTANKVLKSLSRDPTTQATCPGVNNSCAAAATVAFPSSAGSFSSAVFNQSVNLIHYTNSFPSPVCAFGGRDAIWQITPTVGVSNRQFTVNTYKSNFDTMISIWQGTCSSLVPVSCTNGVLGVGGETLSFRTDGTNTFYIVVEGPSGNIGKTNVRITSSP